MLLWQVLAEVKAEAKAFVDNYEKKFLISDEQYQKVCRASHPPTLYHISHRSSPSPIPIPVLFAAPYPGLFSISPLVSPPPPSAFLLSLLHRVPSSSPAPSAFLLSLLRTSSLCSGISPPVSATCSPHDHFFWSPAPTRLG